MITLDGAYLEGGGQIVRTALALSTITGKEFEVKNIRKGREKPGLKNQHLYGISTLGKICNAKVEGAEIGSSHIKYFPGKIKPQEITIDTKTAASITLLLQGLLLPCIFAEKTSKLHITGGTDVNWSPQIDYLKEVIAPQLKKYADIEIKINKRGYFPKGNGSVSVTIKPKKLEKYPEIDLTEQGTLLQVKGIVHSSARLQDREVAERIKKSVEIKLASLNCPINIRAEYQNTLSDGCGITLYAIFSKDPEEMDFKNPIILGADVLGEKGKTSESVGLKCAEKLLEEIASKAPVDEHLADNMIPYIGLHGGKIKVSKITDHTRTNIYVVEQFLDVNFNIDKENKIISCQQVI